jgi:hypothetical protein
MAQLKQNFRKGNTPGEEKLPAVARWWGRGKGPEYKEEEKGCSVSAFCSIF